MPETVLERPGAVSEETAARMAEGVRVRLGADLGLATTGIAGPGGGTTAKPVGLVYLALATADWYEGEAAAVPLGSERQQGDGGADGAGDGLGIAAG